MKLDRLIAILSVLLNQENTIADPEGNLIEIGSWNNPFEEKNK